MTPSEDKPSARAASAGGMLVGTLLLCVLIAAGIGALVGYPGAFAIAGLLIGFPAGIVVVRSRFKEL
jgi:hypothetical protein